MLHDDDASPKSPSVEADFDDQEDRHERDNLQLDDLRRLLHPATALGDSGCLSAVGIGCYYAWLYLTCFTQCQFSGLEMLTLWGSGVELASFAGYLVAVGAAVMAYRHMHRIKNAQIIGIVLVMALCTGLQAVLPAVLGLERAVVPVCIASLFAGIGSGILLCRWAWLYVKNHANMSLQFGGGLLISFVLVGCSLVLPSAAQAVVAALLPLGSGASVVRTTVLARIVNDEPDQTQDSLMSRKLPWRLTLGLCAMGLTYGMSYQGLFEHELNASVMPVSCLLINGVVGFLVVAYAVKAGKNYGFSPINMAVLPIAALGLGISLAYGNDGMPLAFVLMRLAYVMFDSMLWLQMSRVYEKVGTIRAFLCSRLVLEGSVAIGVLIGLVIAVPGAFAQTHVRVVALAFLLFALTMTFQGESIGTVWNLISKSTVRTGKFRKACARITSEYGLTPRESEIMGLVLRGRNGAYIVNQLVISKSTYQTHMRNMYRKLDIHSNQELLDLLEEYLAKGREEEARS